MRTNERAPRSPQENGKASLMQCTLCKCHHELSRDTLIWRGQKRILGVVPVRQEVKSRSGGTAYWCILAHVKYWTQASLQDRTKIQESFANPFWSTELSWRKNTQREQLKKVEQQKLTQTEKYRGWWKYEFLTQFFYIWYKAKKQNKNRKYLKNTKAEWFSHSKSISIYEFLR